ncbi:MAG: cupin domain-containing protein [Verrucomicrobia bacterium]|nr:cupin domain-containing protein [Verrucomicrobiota bacterium]
MPVIDSERKDSIPPGCPVSAFGVTSFGAGEEITMRDHFHDADEFYWIASGRMVVREEGCEFEVRAGQALWTPMGVEHGIARVLEDTTIVWSEMPLQGRKRPGHLHRGEDGPNTVPMATDD